MLTHRCARLSPPGLHQRHRSGAAPAAGAAALGAARPRRRPAALCGRGVARRAARRPPSPGPVRWAGALLCVCCWCARGAAGQLCVDSRLHVACCRWLHRWVSGSPACSPAPQVWLLLHNLLTDPAARAQMGLSGARADALLRLKRHISELLLDQVRRRSPETGSDALGEQQGQGGALSLAWGQASLRRCLSSLIPARLRPRPPRAAAGAALAAARAGRAGVWAQLAAARGRASNPPRGGAGALG